MVAGNGADAVFSPVRTTAATEEAAVQEALQLLGVPREAVQVEVLQQGAKGVTVRVGPKKAQEDAAPAPAVPAAAPAQAAAVEAAAPAEPELEPEPDAWGEDEHDEDLEPAVAAAPPKPVDPEVQERARALAQDFLDRMGMVSQAELEDPPETEDAVEEVQRVYLRIEGEDVGILIGKHGQTLQSFQYVLNLALNNKLAPEEEQDGQEALNEPLRVIVDAGGYRARRAAALKQQAQDAASRARRDRRSIRLEPMPAHERRLVHLALKDETDVTTLSEGREPVRHVVVSPAGMRRAPDRSGERGERGGRSGGYGGGGGRGERGGYGGGGGRGGYGGSGRSGSHGGGHGGPRSGPSQRGGGGGRGR